MSSDSELAVPTATHIEMGGIVKHAVGQAEILRTAIVEQGLSTQIQGREHINVEGWQLVLALNNTVPVIVESAPLFDDEGKVRGYEALCELRDGVLVVGSGYGMCTRSERTWAKRDDYALRSMAETRAIGKACRNRFGFLAKVAGFTATPAEEMTAEQSPSALAKGYALELVDGDTDAAKTLFTAALEKAGIDAVTDDTQAEEVIAILADMAPFGE